MLLPSCCRILCFLCCPHLIAQIRLDWAPLAHGYDVVEPPLDTSMHPSNLVATFKSNAFNASFNAFVLAAISGSVHITS